jgi:tetratricopeptide (TPR) repeat protein
MKKNPYILIFVITVLSIAYIGQPSFSKENDTEIAKVLNQKVFKLFNEGRYNEAIPIAEKALAIREKNLGLEHPEVATSLNNLAWLYKKIGDYSRAEPLFKKSLRILEKVYGPKHPRVATGVNNLAQLYSDLRDYARAEPLYKRALDIREKALGPEHSDVATSLNNLAWLYEQLGDYAKAELFYKKSLAIWQKALGPEHPQVARGYNNLASLYQSLGEFKKAELLYKKALPIWEKSLGPKHPNVAACLNNLAQLYREIGEYTEAVPLQNRALAIWKKVLGQEHPNVATGMNNLALLYIAIGDFDKAQSLLKKCLLIREKILGRDNPDVASVLNNLAALYNILGEYNTAVNLSLKALAIYKKVFGPVHPDVAVTQNSLAEFYRELGEYAKAKALYESSMDIWEKTVGPEHPSVAKSLNNQALLYYAIGDFAKAESLAKRALVLSEAALGADHSDVASCLNTLGMIYNAYGAFSKAQAFYKRALLTGESSLGPDHPDLSPNLNNLANVYQSIGEYKKAEILLKRALTICKRTLGSEHSQTATSLNNLGMLYQSIGEYTKAEPLLQRSLGILKALYGPSHNDVSVCLNNLALLYAAMDDFQKAYEFNKQAQEIDSILIDLSMGFTSEDQKIKFLLKKRGNLYSFISFINRKFKQIESAKKDALNVWLKRKGIVLKAQSRFQEALAYSEDPQAVKAFLDLSRVRTRLSKLAFAGPGKEGLAVYKEKIADLNAQKERLEARLSKLSQAFVLNQKITKADAEKVAGALPKNTVLIEFAKVMMFNFKAKGKEKRWLPAHYIAFVLHAGNGDKVGMVDLGNAGEIDKEITRLKRNIFNLKDIKRTKAIKSSKRIYALVIKPLEKELGSVKKVFISPDGNLNLIPFEILRSPDGKFLIENYTLNYLGAGRDILGFGEIKAKGNKALLIGDPDYDLGADEKDSTLRNLGLSKGIEKAINRRSTDMRGFHFKRLPGTKEEVVAIHMLLGKESSELYTGKEALEELLRKEGRPSILHLATHGFFLDDLEFESLRDDPFDRGIQMASIATIQATDMKIRIENPLIRSGIALAGANHVLKTQDSEKSDGIVTAEKILGLRLRGTAMVVLSACETGIGEVKAGEGVFGLRRAFTQAGAKSLIMSMWSVPDKETKELMIQFYKNIQSGKMNSCQALRQAALNERKIVEKRYGHTNPLFWGAFVFFGEP